MKNFTVLLILSIFAFSCHSCNKDKDPNDPDNPDTNPGNNPGTENVFSMKIDGNDWTPDNVRIRLINDILSIQGQTNTQEALTITVDNQTTGTYTFELGSAHSASYLPDPAEAAYMTGISALSTGTIEVTKLDATNKKLSATFQFNGYRTDGTFLQFTEGKVVDYDIE